MNDIRPYFGVFWGAREQSLGEFIDQSREFLVTLREIDPLFDTLYSLGDRADTEMPVGSDLANLASIALERGWDKKAPKHWFSNLDEEGRPTRESTVKVGWRLSLANEREAEKTKDFIAISLASGQSSNRSNNSVLITLNDPDSPLLDPAMAERLFQLLVDFWNPERGWVTEASYRDAVWDDATREQLGWLNYRADPSIANQLPASVSSEAHGAGIIFRIGDGRALTEDAQAEVAIGNEIQAALHPA
ncbi:hypothetical protein [Microbacterium sp.]|uniref:hypothetical protein n=1 Tax=Microbacterium sp. TaxID=51671 RepID=UPI0026140FDF|nr:hypothetical protein [Microbacterium sp.]